MLRLTAVPSPCPPQQAVEFPLAQQVGAAADASHPARRPSPAPSHGVLLQPRQDRGMWPQGWTGSARGPQHHVPSPLGCFGAGLGPCRFQRLRLWERRADVSRCVSGCVAGTRGFSDAWTPQGSCPRKGSELTAHSKGAGLLVFCGSECKKRLLCLSQPWGIHG